MLAGLAPAVLTGVGAGLAGTAAGAALPADGTCVVSGLSTTCTFSYTGASQLWVVPAGVRSATFQVVGAAGGTEAFHGCCGGRGGGVKALTKVVPGTTMVINVGGTGVPGGRGGWNGGGNGGGPDNPRGAGGGGASDVRIAPFTLDMRIIVGGGGGGQGTPEIIHKLGSGNGGDGGGSTGGGFGPGAPGYKSNTSLDPAYGGGGGTWSPGGGGNASSGFVVQGCDTPAVGAPGGAGSGAVGGPGGYLYKLIGNQRCDYVQGWGGGGGGGYAGGGGGGGGIYGGAGGGGGSGFGPGTSTSFLGQPGADGQVKVTYLTPSTPGWVSLGGDTIYSAPTISERPATGLVDAVQDLFYLDYRGHVIHRTLTTGVPGPPEDLGGPAYPGSTVAAVSYAFDRIDVFVRGTDSLIYHDIYDGQRWTGWTQVDPATRVTSSPSVASWGPGRLDVFARGTTNQLLRSWSTNGTNFAPFENLQGTLKTAPAAVSWGTNRIDIFAGRATTNPSYAGLQQKAWLGYWTSWTDIPTTSYLTSVPAISSAGTAKLDIYYRNDSNGLSRHSYDASKGGWGPTLDLGPVPSEAGAPPAVASLANGQQIVLLRGSDNTLTARTYP